MTYLSIFTSGQTTEEEREEAASPEAAARFNQRVAEKARHFWQEEAGRYLHTTLYEYQKAIEVDADVPGEPTVRLNRDNPLIAAIEDGAPAYDMKPGLLKGATRRVVGVGTMRDMRSVSSNQDHSKWQHPGFRGLNLEEATRDQIEHVIIPEELHRLLKKE